MLLCFQTLTKKKNHHQGQGNPANERLQMLTSLFGHEKSATHTARNVRPFCNSCHRSVAQGAPTASARSPSTSSQPHTPRTEGPGEHLEEVARVSRPRGCPPWCSALSSIFPCNPHKPVGSGLTPLPILVMREPGPRVTVGRQSVDPGGRDPGPEPFNPPMNDPQWMQSPGSLVRETRSLSAT